MMIAGCMQDSGEGEATDSSQSSRGSNANGSASGGNGVDPARPSESDISAATAAAAPVAEGDFCSTLTLAVCDALQSCCSNPERKFADRAECLSNINGCFDYSLPELAEPYDPAQAGAQLELFRRSAQECAIPYPRIINEDVLEATASSGLPASPGYTTGVTGSPTGLPQTLCSEICDVGQYCVDGGCAPQGLQGEPCAVADQCVTDLECRYATTSATELTCNPAPMRGEPCNNRAYCDDFELRCRPVTPGAAMTTCEDLAEQGGGCVNDEDCVTDLGCRSEDGTSAKACLPTAGEGGSCTTRLHCSDGLACVEGECTSCTSHTQCALEIGGFAYAGLGDICAEGQCRPSDEVFGVFSDGATCFEHQHCQSGWCSSGICITPTPDELYCLPTD